MSKSSFFSGSVPVQSIATAKQYADAAAASAASAASNLATVQAAVGHQVIAGNGLTGGGDLTIDRTIDVGPGTGISVAADTVSVKPASLTEIGGVKAVTAVANNWVATINTDGSVTLAQPAFSNISGVAAPTQIPSPSATTIGGVKSIAPVASKWVNSIGTDGTPTAAQPAFSDISGSLSGAQTPAYTGDVTKAAGSTVTALASIPNDVVVAGDLLVTNSVAPATPAVGKVRVYTDSTNKVLSSKNDAGTVSITVVPSTGAASQWATGISASGVVSYAQPAFSNISGVAAAAQLPANVKDLANATLAQGDLLYFNGLNLVNLGAGTSGQFLKTQGAGANPLWAAVPGGGDMLKANNLSDLTNFATARSNISVVGVVRKQVFITSGTYTPSTGMLYCDIECIGGGGGGAGVAGAASQALNACGGGGGEYAIKTLAKVSIGASQVVTIGAGGSGGAAGDNNGSAGGDTSVGGLCSAKGGGGATSRASTNLPGAGGTGGIGDFNAKGQAGGSAISFGSLNQGQSGPGGASGSGYGFGGGFVFSGTGATAGNAGGMYGGGGSGAGSFNSTSTAAGGTGSQGAVIITEYCTQ